LRKWRSLQFRRFFLKNTKGKKRTRRNAPRVGQSHKSGAKLARGWGGSGAGRAKTTLNNPPKAGLPFRCVPAQTQKKSSKSTKGVVGEKQESVCARKNPHRSGKEKKKKRWVKTLGAPYLAQLEGVQHQGLKTTSEPLLRETEGKSKKENHDTINETGCGGNYGN